MLTVKLNNTFEVTRIVHNIRNQNFTLLKDLAFKKNSFTSIMNTPLLDSKVEFSHKLKNYSFEYIEVLIILISCAILLYIIIVSIKCIHFLSIDKTKDNKKIIKIVEKKTKKHSNNGNHSNGQNRD